ncbi:MAG TPA: RDD family protein [Acidobacteriota bacterium]|nr:RDD family protein [Acidobacteriota bacterium]
MNRHGHKYCTVVFLFLALGVLQFVIPTPLRPSVPAQVYDEEKKAEGIADQSDTLNSDLAAHPDDPDYELSEGTLSTGRAQVRIGGSQRVETDQTVRDIITIFGDSELAGRSERDMVTVFGNATMKGSAGRDMVTIFGNAEVNGPVERDLVVVFGNLKLGPNAVVNRDCVVVFGRLDRDPGAMLHQETFEIMTSFSGLGDYLRSGPLMGRLLPPQSIFAWMVVAIHFIMYLLFVLILPKPTAAGARNLEKNPFLCFGVGVLTMILLVPAAIVLGVTIIGILLIPFLWLSEIALAMLGKTSLLQVIGLQILRRFRSDADNRPIAAFFAGFVLLTCIYMIPVLGLLIWIILRPLALGAAILAVFGELRKNGNNSTTAPGIPVRTASKDGAPPDSTHAKAAPESGALSGEHSTATPAAEIPIGSVPQSEAEVTIMPRAGFWIRTVATALDFILLVWLLPLTQEFFLFFWLAYHAAMWTWKGTTIGGIILRLKVVRLDGRPIGFDVALIRDLTAVISAAALFIGFFWAGWSRDRQSWHDIITNTVIVRSPRSVPLI